MKLLSKMIKVSIILFIAFFVCLLVLTILSNNKIDKFINLFFNVFIWIEAGIIVSLISSLTDYFIEKEKILWNVEKSLSLCYARLYILANEFKKTEKDIAFIESADNFNSELYRHSLKDIETALKDVHIYSNIANLDCYSPIAFLKTRKNLLLVKINSLIKLLENNLIPSIKSEKLNLELQINSNSSAKIMTDFSKLNILKKYSWEDKKKVLINSVQNQRG